MQKFAFIVVLVVLSLSISIAAGEKDISLKNFKIKDLYWLQGKWINSAGESNYNENWKINGCDMLDGNSGSTNREGKQIFSEKLRIETIGGHIVYIACVGDNAPVLFTLVSVSQEKGSDIWVFENKEHDFPQRLIYHRTSQNHLRVIAEGLHKGKATKKEFKLNRITK